MSKKANTTKNTTIREAARIELTEAGIRRDISNAAAGFARNSRNVSALIRNILASADPLHHLTIACEAITKETTSDNDERVHAARLITKLMRVAVQQDLTERAKAAEIGDKIHAYEFTSRKRVLTVNRVEISVTAELQGAKPKPEEKADKEAANESERNARLVAQTKEQKYQLEKERAAVAKLQAELAEAHATIKRLNAELKRERKAREKAEAELAAILEAPEIEFGEAEIAEASELLAAIGNS